MSQEMQTADPIATPARAGRIPAGGAGSRLAPSRLTVRQFETMIDAGVFRDEDHVELLGGLLVDKMVKHEPHNFSVGAVGQALRDLLKRDGIVREEKSIVLGRHWRPEPDIAVARAPHDRYRARAPRRGDLELVVEVSDSTDLKDRGVKWLKYAALVDRRAS